jgi:1-deoxy-D-xylulose-5-phosphate reductoisomerase
MKKNFLAALPERSASGFRSEPRVVSVLGSTGSIGTSTLEVVAENPELFRVHALVAGSNVKLLAEQAQRFQPRLVVCADSNRYEELKQLLPKSLFAGEVASGPDAIIAGVVADEVQVVLAAIVGVAGLAPTYAALEAGKLVALANKESLVSAGAIIKRQLQNGTGSIVPVDSEHSAIFQVLQGEYQRDIQSLILTASGGPFRNREKIDFPNIKPAEALKHPNWTMGNKITIDSATMNNKALELIEAYWLYGEDQSKIDVLIHPQSIVHSLIETCDGSQLAQLSVPDMKGAIAYALNYPNGRLSSVMPRLRLDELQKLEFFPVDTDKFSGLRMARECLKAGGSACAIFNLANEVAVEAFLLGRLRFDQIFSFVSCALETKWPDCNSLQDLMLMLSEARCKMQAQMKEF